jgi:hypothetical protein
VRSEVDRKCDRKWRQRTREFPHVPCTDHEQLYRSYRRIQISQKHYPGTNSTTS